MKQSIFTDGIYRIPTPINEPVKNYAPGEPARESLKKRLASMSKETIDIPLIIGALSQAVKITRFTDE
jgi:hypothetical protein